MGVVNEAGLWSIQYRIDGDRLSYAVIQGPSKGTINSLVSTRESIYFDGRPTEECATLSHPNGKKLELLGTGRVFFVSSEIISELIHPISGQTFKAFLDSKPADFYLATLVRFAETYKPKKKPAEQGDAVQPATADDSKSEGKKKAEPESEGRSQ